MTTTRRPLIDLLRRKRDFIRVYREIRRMTPEELAELRLRVDGYFAEIAMGNRELDAAERLRRIDLASLENYASQSLGPIDPRIIGRRGDGSAVFK